MSQSMDIEKWLVLCHTQGVGATSFHKLLQRFETPDNALNASDNDLNHIGLSDKAIRAIRKPNYQAIQADLEWLKDPQHKIICLHDSAYPQRLKSLSDAPPVLFIKGDIALLNDPQVAIVGSRNPTESGKRIAYEFAYNLAKLGILVSSGMARGIDGEAHRGALDADAPSLAVIATGQNIIYPSQNKSLAHQLAKQGVIVSEFPYDTKPFSANFPRRNRIISGLAVGVLVVEAKVKSGALITARLANEQGREVFAIPSSIKNPMSKGCHNLIRQGATLVETVADILHEIKTYISDDINEAQLNLDAHSTEAATNSNLSQAHLKLLEQMGYDPITSDELAERTGIAIEEIASMLLMLELENQISNTNGVYCRIS